jgi:hypothetical protein
VDTERDREQIAEAVKYHVGGKDSREQSAFRESLYQQARAFFADSAFNGRVHALATALNYRGEIDEQEVRRVIRRAA